MSNDKKASSLLVILAFAIVYTVWGSTYFFIQKAIQGIPPLMLGAIRFLAAGMLLLGWSYFRGEKLWVSENVKHAAISGVLLLFVGTGAVIWVEQYLPSGLVAIMASSSPIWVVVLDRPLWKVNFTSKATIAGLIIGFSGVILLFGEKLVKAFSGTGNSAELGSLLLLVAGSMAWAGGSLYSKYNSSKGSATVNCSWQMLAAGFAFVPGSLLRGELHGFHWHQVPTEAWLSVLYLVSFGSLLGFSAYVWLLQVRPATQVSTHSFVNPVVAVLLGMIFANEQISLLQITGLVIILGSVLMINLAKYRNAWISGRLEKTELAQKTPQTKAISTMETLTK